MPHKSKVPPTNPYEDPEPDKIVASKGILQREVMILGLVQQASELSGLPYLSDAADIALNLVQIAQAIKENKEGFQQLADESAQLVAVFYRSYQGAQNQDEWLNSDGIRTTAKDLERCLFSINKLGEKMKARGLFRRILCCVIDAHTIQNSRQRLSSLATRFQELDKRDSTRRAVENEHRARQRIHMEDVEYVASGPGGVVVENGRAPGESGSGSSTPHRHKNKQRSATPCPSPEKMSGVPTRPDISVIGVHSSGIGFGDGDVSVSNW